MSIVSDALIAVDCRDAAVALRRWVKPNVAVTYPMERTMGLRAKKLIITFHAESVSDGSMTQLEMTRQWIDELQLRLVPGGETIYAMR